MERRSGPQEFATPGDVEELLGWVPGRAAAELQVIARDYEGVTVAEDIRSFEDRVVSWWSEDRRLHLKATLPPDCGVVVVKALQRIAYQALPDEQGCYERFDVRCADALRRMASQSIGADPDPDRATVVIHVNAGDLGGGSGAALVEDGPLLATETARRLACDSRWQLFADFEGQTVGIGRISRRIPASLLRALRLRDRCCRFPGCERTRWLHAHHLVHWANGGRTDLENLVLLCGDHHRFVHEGGWTISGDPNNGIEFITRHGRPYAPKHHPLDRERMARLVAAATGRPPGSGPDPPFPSPETEGADAQRATAESATSPRRLERPQTRSEDQEKLCPYGASRFRSECRRTRHSAAEEETPSFLFAIGFSMDLTCSQCSHP